MLPKHVLSVFVSAVLVAREVQAVEEREVWGVIGVFG